MTGSAQQFVPNPNDWCVRPGRGADLPPCLLLERHTASQHGFVPETPVALFEAALDEGFFWVAERDGQQLGYGLAGMVDGLFYIHDLRVAPSHQDKGIGTALMAGMLDKARFLYCAACILPLLFNCTKSEGFARSNGFLRADPDRLPDALKALQASRSICGEAPQPITMVRRL